MAFDDAIGNRQAESGSLAGILGGKKWCKNIFESGRRNTSAGVENANVGGVVVDTSVYLYDGAPIVRVLLSSLDGVCEQIDDDLL